MNDQKCPLCGEVHQPQAIVVGTYGETHIAVAFESPQQHLLLTPEQAIAFALGVMQIAKSVVNRHAQEDGAQGGAPDGVTVQ